MSYEKHVYPATLPRDPIGTWRRALLEHGLDVQFHPDLTDLSWGGGYLPCSLTPVVGSFSTSERYGRAPIYAGFEFTAIHDKQQKASIVDDYLEEMRSTPGGPPPSLIARIRKAPALFSFTHGGFSWSVAEFRVCWFAAATLAAITGGVLFDEWSSDSHGFLHPNIALSRAAERSLAFETSDEEDRWNLEAHTGWGT